MSTDLYNLAIETSSRLGSVSIGCEDRLLGSAALPEPRRHRVDLMPTVARLCEAHRIPARSITEVYVSIGPGSFTGLRIAVTTAKVLAQVLGARIVAVPTVDVVADNIAPSQVPGGRLAVCLNQKGDSVYARLYMAQGESWRPLDEAGVRTLEDLAAAGGTGLCLAGDPLPAVPPGLPVLDPQLAQPHSQAVWRHGRRLATAGRFTDFWTLQPLYARPPEAVELWKKRQAAEPQT